MKYKVGIIAISLFLFACSTRKTIAENLIPIHCLNLLDPFNYDYVKFNPEWISNFKITKIIERNHLGGLNKEIYKMTVLEYNQDGYPLARSSEILNIEQANKNELSSRLDYRYETLNSIVIASVISSKDEAANRKLYFNPSKSSSYENRKNELVFNYEYDPSGCLHRIKDSSGEALCTISHISANKIEIEKWSFGKLRDYKSTVTLGKKGRIKDFYDKSTKTNYSYKYNSKGQLVEEKSWLEEGEPVYTTYEYFVL